MTNLRRALMLAVAIGLTLAVFEFWGKLGSAMGIVLATKVAQPAQPQTQSPGEVSVTIVPQSAYIGLSCPPGDRSDPTCPPEPRQTPPKPHG